MIASGKSYINEKKNNKFKKIGIKRPKVGVVTPGTTYLK